MDIPDITNIKKNKKYKSIFFVLTILLFIRVNIVYIINTNNFKLVIKSKSIMINKLAMM